MLSIGKLGASGGQLEYYERQVAAGAEDYYAGRGEVPGAWLGSGAAGLGLALGGRVSREGFMALTAGRHPSDGSVLRRVTERSKVAAIDLTFSAPKSVSVLFALAGGSVSEALAQAHERAVAAALEYLEQEACWTRRGHAGAERVRGEGFVAAAYRHRLSRAGDPQLHTHVVVANLTRADGRFTALDARALYEHKSAGGAIYRAVLRAEVREHFPGLSWTSTGRGLFEIDGVPARVLSHFSQRRIEIERRVAELVGEGRMLSRAAMQTIALSTRRAKTGPEGELWCDDARARAAEQGFGAADLEALLAQPPAPDHRPLRDAVVGRLSGPQGLTAQHNTFARRHALAELAGEFPDGLSLADLERATDDYLADRSVHTLAETEDGTARYTTAELLRSEQTIIDAATRPRARPAPTVDGGVVEAVLAGSVLNSGQATAVRQLAAGPEAVQTVQALAGTGKTTMLGALAEVYRRGGYRVMGAAPTARAARELHEGAGVPTATLHALANRLHRDHGPLADVLLLDEAGMAGTRISAEIFAHAARTGMKIVAVGDAGQLASVEAGGWFSALAQHRPGPALHEVLRQHDPSERDALAELHDGNASAYVEHKADAITVHAEESDALEAAVRRWSALADTHGPGSVVMIARDNRTREQLNAAARAHLLGKGQLPGRSALIGAHEWTVGDRVITRHNDRRLDVDNGTCATVTGIDETTGLVAIRTDSGQHRALDARYVAEHLEHAYAITGHASQGATVDAAVVVGRPEEFTREWAYTALSRARHATTLELISEPAANEQDRADYAPTITPCTREPVDVLEALTRAMQRSDHDTLAIDHTERSRDRRPAPPTPVPDSHLTPGFALHETRAPARRPRPGCGVGAETDRS